MKVLLTGSTGFIGGAFLRKAIEKGHVVGALILPELEIPKDLESNKNVVWLRGSLKEPPWDLIEKFSPESCVHTAWIATPGIYLESPRNYEFLNDSVAFITKATSLSVRHVVVTGTCAEYGPSIDALKEDFSPIEPASTYAKCKHQLHLNLIEESRKLNFDLCWTRIFYPYGLGEHPERLCSWIIRKLLYNESVYIKYPYNVCDYIYIDDLASALLHVMEKKYSGAINLGTGVGTSVSEIAGIISNAIGKPHLIEQPFISVRDSYIIADISKLKSLGWEQQVNLEDGIQKLVLHYSSLMK